MQKVGSYLTRILTEFSPGTELHIAIELIPKALTIDVLTIFIVLDVQLDLFEKRTGDCPCWVNSTPTDDKRRPPLQVCVQQIVRKTGRVDFLYEKEKTRVVLPCQVNFDKL